MHEFSIVQNLLDLIERYARKNRAERVTEIVVSVGVLSGVEPHLLKVAFDTFKEGTVAESAELVIEIEKLDLRCRDCGKVSGLEEPRFVCPFCGSLNTEASGGDGLILKRLEMECHEGSAEGKN